MEEGQYIAEAAKYVSAALCALSMMMSAYGVQNIWINMINVVGRNPEAKKAVDIYGWAGFAVTEAIALYALVIALVTLFK